MNTDRYDGRLFWRILGLLIALGAAYSLQGLAGALLVLGLTFFVDSYVLRAMKGPRE